MFGGALLVLVSGGSPAHAAAPTLTTVSIASNATTASTSYADTGNVVTLTLVGSGAIGSVSVAFTSGGSSVAGAVTLASTSQSAFTAAYTVNAADTDGAVGFTINYKSHTTQEVATPVTAVVGASYVKVDKVTPTFSSLVSFPTITSTTSTITVNWTSSEPASESWIEYGTTTALGTHASESATYGKTAHSVSVTGLTQCTAYHFKVHSQDYILHEGTGSDTSIMTAGCGAIEHPSSGGSTNTPTPTPAPYTTSTPTPTPTPYATPTPTPGVIVGMHGNGTLVTYAGDPKVYVIENGMKRWIQSAQDFNGLGYQWGNIVTVPGTESYPDGAVMMQNRGQVTALFVHYLAKGAKGSEVRALQEKLKALGFFPATVDATGYYGPTTIAAVKAFQSARNLPSVGYVGPATRAELNK